MLLSQQLCLPIYFVLYELHHSYIEGTTFVLQSDLQTADLNVESQCAQ